ncbi:hypothetical protein HPB47_018764, partial [Ixodes persulcatus]
TKTSGNSSRLECYLPTIRERLLLDSILPFEQVVKIVLNIERVKAEAKEITVTTEKQLTCNVTHAAQTVDYRPSRGASSSRQLAGQNFPPCHGDRHSSQFQQES